MLRAVRMPESGIDGLGIFTQLKDQSYFASVRANPRFVSWPQEQDFSLDTLWSRSRILRTESTP